MKHSFASLMIAGVALSAVPYSVMSAKPGDDRLEGYGGPVEILVDGVPQRRYAHNGRWYVEALKGREYAISGWQVNSNEARRFEFTTEAESYGQALGKTANLGTISAVFFKERVAKVARESARERNDRTAPAQAAPAAPSAAPLSAPTEQRDAARPGQKLADEYAATGMGQRTGHAVTQVWLDLEDKPAQTTNIRYEFRAQLVKLGILRARVVDPMARRERARGFEPGFSPEVPRP